MTNQQYNRYRLWQMRLLAASTERQRNEARSKLDKLFAELQTQKESGP